MTARIANRSRRTARFSYRSWPVILFFVLLACVILALIGGTAYYFLRPGVVSAPLVYFTSPTHHQQVPVGRAVSLQAVARDAQKVTRVELWVDGELVHAQTSGVKSGLTSLPVLASWLPPVAGEHTLVARAFNTRHQRGQATIQVEAVDLADKDGDGTADAADVCPDQPGTELANGCPDQDGDGIQDAQDACPDQSGIPAGNGCPTAAAGDRDGDGFLDSADSCPDTPGSPIAGGCPDADGDGVADSGDTCPSEAGPAEAGGCPASGDSDHDGVPDASDLCPEEGGSTEAGGCPESAVAAGDSDGDGALDPGDLCPDVPGERGSAGCPPSGAGDRDGDGVFDDVDPCPDEPGLPEHGGCPAPGEGADSDGDGIPDAEEAPGGFQLLPPWWFGSIANLVSVEVKALSFSVDQDHGLLTCYTTLSNMGTEHWGPFDLSLGGGGIWDLQWWAPTPHGSSRQLWLNQDTSLNVHVECGLEEPAAPGGVGVYYNLGSFTQSHPYSEWDQQFEVPSSGGEDGRSFTAKYQLCMPNCDEAALPPPILHLYNIGGNWQLVWIWEGDHSLLQAYRLYVNGSPVFTIDTDRYGFPVDAWVPPCESQYEFALTAIGPDGRESALSNPVTRQGESACQITVEATFEGLDVHDPPADEEGLHRPGPIYGDFHVFSGSSYAGQNFDACWCYVGPGSTFWGWCEGLVLPQGVYNIQAAIYDWINTQIASCIGNGCHSNWFGAPESNVVSIQMPRDGELTIGGRVMDCDSRGNADDTVFEEEDTVIFESPDPIPAPVQVRIPGSHLDLIVNLVFRAAGP